MSVDDSGGKAAPAELRQGGSVFQIIVLGRHLGLQQETTKPPGVVRELGRVPMAEWLPAVMELDSEAIPGGQEHTSCSRLWTRFGETDATRLDKTWTDLTIVLTTLIIWFALCWLTFGASSWPWSARVTMTKKEPRVFKCFVCYQKLTSANNYYRHMETNNTFSYSSIYGRDGCEAAFCRHRIIGPGRHPAFALCPGPLSLLFPAKP